MSRSRAWCFTINNPTDDDIKKCDLIACEYIITGNEVGEKGTPHVQGYIEFKEAKTLSAVKKLLCERAHLETRKGTAQQAADYCKKENNFTERGNISQQGKRNDLEEIAQTIKKGGVQAIIEERPDAFIKYGRNIERFAELLMKPRTNAPTVIWLWGKTGTYKTRTATEGCDNNYYIWTGGKWWNGYKQQQRIVIDDYTFDGTDASFRYLLRLLDRYAIQVETKGGMVHINSPEIYITCEFPPEQIFSVGNELAQVNRRLTEIKEMGAVIYEDDLIEDVPDNVIDELGDL